MKGHEKYAPNVYKSRLHLIGDDPSMMPFFLTPLATLVIPTVPSNPLHLMALPPNGLVPHQQMRPQPPMIPTGLVSNRSNSPLSPPMQSSSPLVNQSPESVSSSSSSKGNNTYVNMSPSVNMNPAGQRTIGSEMKMLRLSVDALIGSCGTEKSETCKTAFFFVVVILFYLFIYLYIFKNHHYSTTHPGDKLTNIALRCRVRTWKSKLNILSSSVTTLASPPVPSPNCKNK